MILLMIRIVNNLRMCKDRNEKIVPIYSPTKSDTRMKVCDNFYLHCLQQVFNFHNIEPD